MEIVLVKTTKEARQLLNIMSAQDDISSQELLAQLIINEYNKRNNKELKTDMCKDKGLIEEMEEDCSKSLKQIKFPKLLNKLIKKGHSEDRATKIILEAEESSNPAYILNYYGIKISEVCEK